MTTTKMATSRASTGSPAIPPSPSCGRTEYKCYKADAFELDDMRSIADIFHMNGEALPTLPN
jgi:uncharacterized protein YbbK (DUF523 family)